MSHFCKPAKTKGEKSKLVSPTSGTIMTDLKFYVKVTGPDWDGVNFLR